MLKKAKIQYAGIERDDDLNFDNMTGFSFVYPYGTTMKVKEPSLPILTSGSVCYPVNETIMSMYESDKGGKLFVLGSWKIFSDKYWDKEENKKIFSFIFENLNP